MFIPPINLQLLKWNVNIILGWTKVCACVCVCTIYFKTTERQIEQHIIALSMVFNKEVVTLLDIAIALAMPTLLPSLHYSLSWEAEKKNCICRLPDMLLQLCLDEWGTGGHEGKEDSKCIDCLDCHSPRSNCASPGNFLFASLFLGYWYLLFPPILQDLQ